MFCIDYSRASSCPCESCKRYTELDKEDPGFKERLWDLKIEMIYGPKEGS